MHVTSKPLQWHEYNIIRAKGFIDFAKIIFKTDLKHYIWSNIVLDTWITIFRTSFQT